MSAGIKMIGWYSGVREKLSWAVPGVKISCQQEILTGDRPDNTFEEESGRVTNPASLSGATDPNTTEIVVTGMSRELNNHTTRMKDPVFCECEGLTISAYSSRLSRTCRLHIIYQNRYGNGPVMRESQALFTSSLLYSKASMPPGSTLDFTARRSSIVSDRRPA